MTLSLDVRAKAVIHSALRSPQGGWEVSWDHECEGIFVAPWSDRRSYWDNLGRPVEMVIYIDFSLMMRVIRRIHTNL